MYVYLSKLLPLLVLPLGGVLILMMFALALLWLQRRRSALASLLLALAVLWVSSMPLVAEVLYGRLEAPYPPVDMAEIPPSDCIVLLGGVVGPPMEPRVDTELSEAIDRVYKAAQLYREGKARIVVVAAGNQPWSEAKVSEAETIADLLGQWGVPRPAILLDGASRNTRENAVNSKALMDEGVCPKPLLVTSAAHMPRAVAAFRKVGVEVFPVSTDVRVVPSDGHNIFDFLPQAGALSMTTEAIREWMGQVIYRWRGWN